MIDITKLKESDKGRWVVYTGDISGVEFGRIKSWNADTVFVVFQCNREWNRFQDFTGNGCNASDVSFARMGTLPVVNLERIGYTTLAALKRKYPNLKSEPNPEHRDCKGTGELEQIKGRKDVPKAPCACLFRVQIWDGEYTFNGEPLRFG